MAIGNPQAPHFQLRAVVDDAGPEVIRPAANQKWFAPHRDLERNAEVDLTFFVACYNEEKNIVDTLENLRTTMIGVPLTYDIVVMDDGSKDRSAELTRQYQDSHPDMDITLVTNPKNRGLAWNFVDAAFLGRGVYYKLICGDNVDDVDSLRATLQHVGEADLVIPYHQEIQGRSWARACCRGLTPPWSIC